MITLKEHFEALVRLMKNHPEWEDLPIIYASDDEGNSYHNVYSNPSPAQVQDINSQYLEIVGIYIQGKDAESEDISRNGVNCIIIN